MADHFSLLGFRPPGSGQPQPGLDPRAQMMAAPSGWDVVLNRGSYAKRFSQGRKAVVKGTLIEKRRTRQQFRHDEKEDLRRLKRGDPRVFQKYGIKMNERANKPGLDEKTQQRYLHENIKEVKEEMKEQRSAALRVVDKNHTLEVKKMRDNLREELYSTAA